MLSSVTQGNSAKGQAPASTPSPAPFSNFSSFTSAPASQSGTPQPLQRSAFSPPTHSPAPAADPFAALASLSSKPATPAQPAAVTNDDDEWSFSSALPPEAPSVPKEHQAVVSNTSLKVDMLAKRIVNTDPSLSLLFAFTNNTAQPVSELHFQLAVTKVRCHTKSLSGRTTNSDVLGLRARVETAVREDSEPEAEPGSDAVDQCVAFGGQDEEGRSHQAEVESVIQGWSGTEAGDGRDSRVQCRIVVDDVNVRVDRSAAVDDSDDGKRLALCEGTGKWSVDIHVGVHMRCDVTEPVTIDVFTRS